MKQCDECGSEFYADLSKMKGLCPECANVLYGYPKCDHIIENDDSPKLVIPDTCVDIIYHIDYTDL